MIYSVKAVDQLFFRSSTPFDSEGGTHLLASQFPPYPTTYAGTFKMLGAHSNQFRISYNGIILSEENNQLTFCFPQPLDTIGPPDKMLAGKENKLIKLEKMKLVSLPHSNAPLIANLIPKESGEKRKTLPYTYLKQTELEKYLSFDEDTVDGFSLKDYFSEEMKIGIAIDSSTDTTEKGMLYQIKMVRPQPELQLAVELTRAEVENGSVKLGGEGKVAQFEAIDNEITITSKLNDNSKYFKLYFATPAIFERGWLPKWIKKDMTGCFSYKGKKVKLELVSAAIGRYEAVGGFNPSQNQPKELRYAIPAGSVYYFKIIEGDLEKVKKLFHQKCISDYRESFGFKHEYFSRDRLVYCDRGFGYALVGAVNNEQEMVLKCLKEKN